MKLKLLITILCFSSLTYGQERWTYQSDNIYKANKVKARKWFNGNKLTATTFYDIEGRTIKFELAPFLGGEQKTTHFKYDEKGKLISQIDTIYNGKPDKKALKKLKKMGLDLSSKIKNDKPSVEVSKYNIDYSNGEIEKLTQYNPDGTLDIVDHFESIGKKEIRDWYRNGELYRQCTSEYIDAFHKEKYYGWEILPNSNKTEWNYLFKYVFDNGQVKEFTRFENGEQKEITKLEYDKNGLLVKASYYTTEQFEYEYYN